MKKRPIPALLPLCTVSLLAIVCSAAFAEPSKYFDAKTMIGLDEIHPGMKGTCRTTFVGTAPEEFQIEVMQIVRDLYPGLDYVLFRMLDGQCVERKSGVIGGMSGSPVYFDGRLAGALSRGPAPIRQPLAMFTPIDYMLRTLENIDKAESKSTLNASGVQVAQLDEPLLVDGQPRDVAVLCDRADQVPAELQGRAVAFVPCTPTFSVSGVPDGIFPVVKQLFAARGLDVTQGVGGTSDLPPYELTPGCPIGLGFAVGDVAMGTAGTLTWTDGKRFLAFGHGMSDGGAVNLPATYHEILESLTYEGARSEKWDQPLKAAPIGTVLYDDINAVGGEIGRAPTLFPLDITVTDTDSKESRTYHSKVCRDEQYSAMMPAIACLSVLEPWVRTQQDYVIEGRVEVTSQKGRTIRTKTFEHTKSGPTMTAALEAMTAVSVLMTNIFEPQDVASIAIDFTVTRSKAEAQLLRLELDDWTVQTGTNLRLKVVYQMVDGQGTKEQIVEVPIPADLPSGQTQIVVTAGAGLSVAQSQLGYTQPTPVDLTGLIAMVTETMVPDNHLVAIIGKPGQAFLAGGRAYPSVPADVAKIMGQAGTTDYASSSQILTVGCDTPYQVVGMLQHPLTVYRPEDRAAMAGGASANAVAVGQMPELTPVLARQAEQVVAAARLSSLSRYLSCSPSLLQAIASLGSGRATAALWGEGNAPDTSQVLSAFPALWSLLLQGPPPPGIHMPENAVPGELKPVKPKAQTTESTPEGATGEGAEGETTEGETEESATIEALPIRQPKTVVHKKTADFRPGELTGVSLREPGGISLAPAAQSMARFCPDALQAWALVPDGAGGAYLGTGPKGVVYRVGSDGSCKEFFRTDDAQVFALATAPDGSLWVGTGPSGMLYHLSPEGKALESVATGEAYVWDLVIADDAVLAATGPNGKLLRAGADGALATIADVREPHILSLATTPDGAAYLGTEEGFLYRLSPDGYVHGLGKSPIGSVYSIAASSAGTVYFGSVGNAYRITPDDRFEPMITSPDMGGYAVATAGDTLFLGCSQSCGIYAVDSEAKAVSAFGLLPDPEATITALATDPAGDALWTLTTGPIAVYRTPVASSPEGAYTSPVLSAEKPSEWLRADWRGRCPEGATVEIATRTGNTPLPDESWSLWTDTTADESGACGITSPAGIYLQYQVRLRTGDVISAIPDVAQVQISYLPANEKPTVTYDDVSKLGFVNKTAELSWDSSDPNDDTLRYSAYSSADQGLTWKALKEDTTDKTYSWDVAEVEEGRYLVKVVASDEAANPGRGLTAEIIVGPVTVDRTGPKAMFGASSIAIEDGVVRVKGAASDKESGVKIAQYRVDAAETWQPIAAGDLRYDSAYELLSFVVEGLEPGKHTLEVVVFDQAGNQTLETREVEIPGAEEAEG